MISEPERERATNGLLSLATEDWYSIAEGESAVRKLLPHAGSELRQVVTAALMSLLERGLVQVARLNLATGEADPIPEWQVRMVLEDDETWNPPQAQDGGTICFTATPLGEQRYFGTPDR